MQLSELLLLLLLLLFFFNILIYILIDGRRMILTLVFLINEKRQCQLTYKVLDLLFEFLANKT